MGILRVLLALAVFGEHVAPPADFLRMWGGTLAVAIFFVISGFYMELVLTRTYANPRVFWINRAARIYPTYWIVALLALLTSGGRYASAFSFGISTSILFIVANSLIFLQDAVVFLGVDSAGHLYFAPDFSQTDPKLYGYLLVPQAWSLGLELTFYLLCPFLHRWRTWMLFGLVAACSTARLIAYRHGFAYDPWTYRFFPFELAGFVGGMLSCRFYFWLEAKNIPLRIRWVAAILVLGLLIATSRNAFNRSMADFYLISLLCGPAVAVIFLGAKDWEWDRKLGDLSYPIYLSHLLILDWVAPRISDPNALFVCTLIGTLALSTALLVLVDWPVDRIRHRLTKARERLHPLPQTPS